MTITTKTMNPRGEFASRALEQNERLSPRVRQPFERKPLSRVEKRPRPDADLSDDFRQNGYGMPETTMGVQPSTTKSTTAAFETRQPTSTYDREQSLLDWLDWLDASCVRQTLLIASMVVGIFLAVIFGLDLIGGWIFWRASLLMDASYSMCGLALIYLCWTTLREIR